MPRYVFFFSFFSQGRQLHFYFLKKKNQLGNKSPVGDISLAKLLFRIRQLSCWLENQGRIQKNYFHMKTQTT